MTIHIKNVCYMKYLPDPLYIDIMMKRPDVKLDNLDHCGTDAARQPILEAAHVYQITVARDEIRPDLALHQEGTDGRSIHRVCGS